MDEIFETDVRTERQPMFERAPYLTTHRAVAGCTRELSRLSDELHARAITLASALGAPAPVVRRPPGRCLIQLGPVALTVVWVHHTLSSVAEGELMINIWRGAVSPHRHNRTERPADIASASPATLLWERVFAASAESEALWAWSHDTADAAPMDSTALACLCVEQLGLAYLDTPSTPDQP